MRINLNLCYLSCSCSYFSSRANSNTGHLESLVESMRPFLTDLSSAVVEP